VIPRHTLDTGRIFPDRYSGGPRPLETWINRAHRNNGLLIRIPVIKTVIVFLFEWCAFFCKARGHFAWCDLEGGCSNNTRNLLVGDPQNVESLAVWEKMDCGFIQTEWNNGHHSFKCGLGFGRIIQTEFSPNHPQFPTLLSGFKVQPQ
jgi:hypothetical protein